MGRCCRGSCCLCWSALLHFLIAEVRPIYPLYASVYGIVAKTGSLTLQEYTEPVDFGFNETMLDRYFCIEVEVLWTAWTPPPLWKDRGCFPDRIRSGYRLFLFNFASLCIAGLFVWVLLIYLCCRGAFAGGFAGGRYLVETWSLGESRIYKAAVAAMAVFFLSGFGAAFFITSRKLDLLRGIGLEVAVIVASFVFLVQRQAPSFPRGPGLTAIRFRRPWHTMFWQSNDQFAHALSTAMWCDGSDGGALLDTFLLDSLQRKDLLAACGAPIEETPKPGADSDLVAATKDGGWEIVPIVTQVSTKLSL